MKGYELIKKIEDGNIELGTQFIDIYGNIYCWKKYGLMEEASFVKVNESQGEYIPDMSMIIKNSFEILEEDKPIEELQLAELETEKRENGQTLLKTDTGYLTMRKADVLIINKINELVKEIDKLKENK